MTKVFMKGCEAIAEAAVRAGCRFFAGYPITPQNEIPEYMARRMPEVDGVFVQGESEVASVNMVFGAASSGTRAMTSSSGPGISLKTDGISNLAGAELPAVIVDVSRGGPGLGSIQAAQMDYLLATKACGHGGFRMLVYAPATVQEAVDLTYLAFDKAEKYQAPMMVCADGCIGAMMEPVVLPEMRKPEKMQLHTFASEIMGKNRLVIASLYAPDENQELFNKKKAVMYEKWEKEEGLVEEFMADDAELVVVAYGTTARIAKAAASHLRERGYKIGVIRPITIHPFPYDSFEKLEYGRLKCVLCIEMSIPCQLIEDVRSAVAKRAEIETLTHSGGILFDEEEVIDAIIQILERE